MTIEEIHYEFHLMADKVFGNDRRSFSVSEVDGLLAKAQRQILNQTTDVFELNSKRIHDLSTLHVKWPVQPTLSAISSGTISSINGNIYVYETRLYDLVYNYMSFTKLAVNINKNNCTYRAIGRYVDNDDFEYSINSSFELNEQNVLFNIGISSNSIGVDASKNRSIYIYSKYPIDTTKIYLEYIKQPQNPTLGGYLYFDNTTVPKRQCELPDKLHSKLVDIAIQLAFTSMNDQAVQLKANQVLSSE